MSSGLRSLCEGRRQLEIGRVFVGNEVRYVGLLSRDCPFKSFRGYVCVR